jgi:hypothetical protein
LKKWATFSTCLSFLGIQHDGIVLHVLFNGPPGMVNSNGKRPEQARRGTKNANSGDRLTGGFEYVGPALPADRVFPQSTERGESSGGREAAGEAFPREAWEGGMLELVEAGRELAARGRSCQLRILL